MIPKNIEAMLTLILFGRVGAPEDVADTIAFLVYRAHYVSDAIYVVDGGLSR